ncbi:hypothetical protein THRCLA_00165 [Thraustotheca clavata]|uniref:DUF501 domain-containing protein n=1 Tax=Thraustotheca clavata TaxID=74557 RepID=A0A1W0AC20_9STRA|nr:hypothetical protein THRCLA_00165 [Thraustotheca clavata]
MEDEHHVFLDLGEVAHEPMEEPLKDTYECEGVACEVKDKLTLLALERNLGSVPNNLIRVVATHENAQHCNEPAVLLLYPLRNCMDAYKKHHRAYIEPFPTTYWLASTELKEKVSILEGMGFVEIFTDRLVANPQYAKEMEDAHQSYADFRWSLLTPRDIQVIKAKQWEHAIKDVGIAGIRNRASVKCLHTHYAHYLATKSNLVGKWVHEALMDLKATAVIE